MSLQAFVLQEQVRHVGPSDEISSLSLLRVSKALATRDEELATVINQLVGAINNQARCVTLPAVPALVAGNATVVLCNFRIPAGYEARPLNVSVASSRSGGALAELCHQAGFFGGDGTGVNSAVLVEATAEVNVAGEWVGSGEFVLKITNTDERPAEIKTSALIELRPV